MPINLASFFRIVLPVILLVVFSFATSSLAKTPSSNLSVMGIYIHIKKENNNDPAGVKRQAVMQAQREAFRILIERFGSTSELPEDMVIISSVRDYEIRNEQSYPTKYEATFNVHFRQRALEYIDQR